LFRIVKARCFRASAQLFEVAQRCAAVWLGHERTSIQEREYGCAERGDRA